MQWHERLGKAAYGVSIALIGLMGFALYYSVEGARRSAASVDGTRRVLGSLADVNAHLSRAESAQRGYVLYGEPRYLDQRNAALAELAREIERTRTMLADDPPQASRLQEIERLVERRTALMRAREAQRRAMPAQAAPLFPPGTDSEKISQAFFALTSAMREEEVRQLEAQRRIADETQRTFSVVLVASMLIFTAIVLPGYAGFLRQSRARHRAERRMEELTQSLPGAVVQYRTYPDGRSKYEFITQGARALRGIDVQKALSDPEVVLSSIRPEDRPILENALREGAKTLTPIEADYRVKDGAGRELWIRTSAAPRREADGSVLWSAHWADVTEQKRLEAELRRAKREADQANRAKSTFLATMSHEIRTPMNGVLGMLELLALTKLDREQKTTLAVIRQSSKSLLRIIDDILDFSKVEAGKLDLHPEPASLHEIVDRVRNIYSGAASSKGLVIAAHVDPRVSPYVMVDPVRLQQVLNNLVSNAIKFTRHGEVSIAVRLLGREDGHDRVEITVTDTGQGVKRDDLQRLFRPFAQAAGPLVSSQGGTGLGLSICRRLVELMGGTIDMESQLGVGTRVVATLRVPIADGEGAAQSAQDKPDEINEVLTPPEIAQAEVDGTLVLLVDDHPINRLVLVKQVNALGYAAESASDGAEALGMWRARRFALVITDCNMPEMSGYELARRIREEEAREGRPRTPIVACTANALGTEVERCFAEGMDDYLAKPVEIVHLRNKLEQWVRPPAAQAAGTLPTLDESVLKDISAGDEAMARQTLRRFREYNDQDFASLSSAIHAGDLKNVLHLSHRMKGSSRTVGALRMADVCEAVEQAARAEDWKRIHPLFSRLEAAVSGFNRHIEGGGE